jgi:xanthine dehydrogenase accessory factor
MPAPRDIIGLIGELRAEGQEFCVATIVRTEHATSAKAGAKAVVTQDGRIEGFLGGGCVQAAVRRAATLALETGRPELIRVRPKEEVAGGHDADGAALYGSACPSGGVVDIFIEPLRRPPRLVVCGASPVAVALIDLAQRLGYAVTAAARAEDRAAVAAADQIVEGLDPAAAGPLDAHAAIVVATQGKGDHEALATALRSEAGFVGFVSSRKKAEALRERLGREGIATERLKAPVGLWIQAIEPAEIALSILAELVEWRRAGQRDGALSSG